MILDQILAATQKRASALPFTVPHSYPNGIRSLSRAIMSTSRKNPIIGELKFSSLAIGALRNREHVERLAEDMVRGGCIALSVLTEPTFFGGSVDFLTQVRERVPVPVLRKDFIVDTKQVYETRAMGADAILLIARILKKDLRAYVSLSRSLGLEPLVEVHTAADISLALASGAELIGINNRDLRTLKVDLRTTERLAPLCRNAIRISMSGITTADDISRLRESVHAFLIGTALMKTPDLRAALERFVSA